MKVFTSILKDLLFKELREKRAWCYTCGAKCTNLQDLFRISITAGIAPEGHRDIEEIVQKCIEVTSTAEQLERKKHLKQQAAQWLDYSGRQMCRAMSTDLEEYQQITTIREWIAELEQVSADDMRAISEFLQPANRLVVTLVP